LPRTWHPGTSAGMALFVSGGSIRHYPNLQAMPAWQQRRIRPAVAEWRNTRRAVAPKQAWGMTRKQACPWQPPELHHADHATSGSAQAPLWRASLLHCLRAVHVAAAATPQLPSLLPRQAVSAADR
jgi:hypothetical protein